MAQFSVSTRVPRGFEKIQFRVELPQPGLGANILSKADRKF